MMTKDEFTKKLVNVITTMPNMEASIIAIKDPSINDVPETALLSLKTYSFITPKIYLDEYYEDYLNGISFASIVDVVKRRIADNTLYHSFPMEFFSNWKHFEDRIFYKVINTQESQDFLKNIAHVELLNLSKVFYIAMNNNFEDGLACIPITTELMQFSKCTLNDLVISADRNTPCLFPPKFRSMSQVLEELLFSAPELPNFLPSKTNASDSLFVLTNYAGLYGASTIFYPDVLERISEVFHYRNFYILPSSIHEVLILIDDGEDLSNRLVELVQEVNPTLLPSEVLADCVYYYNYGTNSLSVA